MTDLKKPVRRRTAETSKDRRIIVEVHPAGILRFRLERCRYFYDLPIKTAWVYAAMLTAAAKRAEKAAERAKRKAG